MTPGLHRFLDMEYGPDGDAELERRLAAGEAVDGRAGAADDAPLHVAARRRRLRAAELLLDHGADIDARNAHGKTAYAMTARRGFAELVEMLAGRGADPTLTPADELAVAVVAGRLGEAGTLLARDPGIARTGNPEEDRLLADVAGREAADPVRFLVAAGADLAAPGLDTGTPLHVAAWFGQPTNVDILIEAGAPLDVFEPTHESSPLGWAVHGARFSGGADQRQDAYVAIVRRLLEAGSPLEYPDDPGGEAYRRRLMEDATPAIEAVLLEWMDDG